MRKQLRHNSSHAARAKGRRRRIGSVMIMVVALLVMLALVGTAYIATSTTDRTAATHAAANTQADLLMSGLVDRVGSLLSQDNFDNDGFFRPAHSFPSPGSYDPYDAPGRGRNLVPNRDDQDPVDQQLPEPALPPGFREDDWMASRVPEFRTPGFYHPGKGGGSAEIIWPYISGPMGPAYTISQGLTGAVTHYVEFEDPVTGRSFGGPNSGHNNIDRIPFREDVRITTVTHNGIDYPALEGAEGDGPYVAADNDGDGIADGAFTRLADLGQLQGLTWYASSRVIDNAAAININTAWENKASTSYGDGKGRQARFTGNTPPYFPSSTAIWDLLNDADPNLEIERLIRYRVDYESDIYRPLESTTLPNGPIDEVTLRSRSDYQFADRFDLMWMQLGRRLQVPGIMGETSSRRLVYGKRLPEADALSMASGFVVRLRNNASWDDRWDQHLGHTVTERFVLPYTLSFRNSDSKSRHPNDQPYKPSDGMNGPSGVRRWFATNFDYYGTSTNPDLIFDGRGDYSRRPLLTTVNPVADAIRPHYADNNSGVPDSEMLPYFPEYLYDDKKIVPEMQSSELVGYTRNGKVTPWSLAPTRAPLNTAGFPELYRAFWNVMAYDRGATQGSGMHTPFWIGGDKRNLKTSDPEAFYEDYSNIYKIDNHPLRMFRSTLRDNREQVTDVNAPDDQRIRMPGNQVMLLRAALAAVNAMDMRDKNNEVSWEELDLKMYHTKSGKVNYDTGAIPIKVIVYGYEAQPFISEVYANTAIYDPTDTEPDPSKKKSNKRGFVAVELANPHGGTIDLGGWKLLVINRRHDRTPDEMREVGMFSVQELYTFPAGVKVGGFDHLVLHNYKPAPTGQNPPNDEAAQILPKSLGSDLTDAQRTHLVVELGRVIHDSSDADPSKPNGGELVLVRPRPQNMTSAELRELPPADNFDFTGLKMPSKTAAAPDLHVMHYVRKFGAGNDAFHVVYPGRYRGNRTGAGTELRQEGAKVIDYNPLADPPKLEPDPLPSGPSFGNPNTNATFTHPFANPITLGNPKWFGTSANKFPFGRFATVTDVYRVPFIGAYTVRPLSGNQTEYHDNGDKERTFEMNGVSMDASFADDTDTASDNDKYEVVGRFWPIGNFANLTNPLPGDLDIQDDKKKHHAQHDYEHHRTERARLDGPPPGGNPLPVDIRYLWARDVLDYFTVLAPHDDYAPFGRQTPIRPVLNSDTEAAQKHGQAFVPPVTEGLININTAPLPVLAMLPFTDFYETNAKIADQIIEYREKYGPFAHLGDLLRVPLLVIAASPNSPGPGEDIYEAASRCLARVANMITIRSDSYTAYITLQGWRNPGTANAEMVVQRRAVVVFDRSGVIKSVNANGPRYERGVKSMYMQLD